MDLHAFPHPEPPAHLPPHPIPLGHPSTPALKDGNDSPTCKTEKETQMYRTDFWTL